MVRYEKTDKLRRWHRGGGGFRFTASLTTDPASLGFISFFSSSHLGCVSAEFALHLFFLLVKGYNVIKFGKF